MADAGTPKVNEQLDSRSTAMVSTEPHNGEWGGVSVLATPPVGRAAPDVSAYLHALRRHWGISLVVGVVFGGVIAVAAWFGIGSRFTASSFLRVTIEEKMVFKGDSGTLDRDRFEIFKNTQRELLMSRFVMIAALRKPEVNRIPDIQEEQRTGDAADWLQRHISVSFPGRAEVMEVSMTRRDGQEAAVMVGAVVDSYLTEVVNAERDQKRQRLNELERACAEKEQQLRTARQQLKDLAKDYGSSETETITLKQKLVLEELALYRQELARLQFDMRRTQSDLMSARALITAIDTMEVPGQELDELIMADPVAKQLSFELAIKKMDQAYTDSAVSPGVKNRYADRYHREIEMLQEQYDAILAGLAAKAREKKRAMVNMEIVKLETAISVMKDQEEATSKEIKAMRDEAQKFGDSTVDIEMLRTELKQLTVVMTELANERDKVRIELRSTPRVTMVEKAEAPTMPSNTLIRIVLTAAGFLGGLCAPAAAIGVLDVRSRRINTAEDVSQRLQLPVIGAVPLIPPRVIRHLGSPSKRYQSWQVRLTESVDGITARLLRKADVEQCRVIMISSAVGGEGKTTLATQVSLSLARAGRRVVLVDFDLRRPSFDEVFGVPLEPGVCEILRRQSPVSELVQPTGTENLSVLTAGRWDRPALASLSNGCAAAMFKQLREEYDFVVIDTSPLLPVADARFVSQHVDTVVLSVLRDISKAPKIQAALDILAAFGVHSVEAVVTGANSNLYGKHMGYESTITA